VGLQQGLDTLPQGRGAGAGLVQEGQPFLGGRFLQGGIEDGFDALGVGNHGAAPGLWAT
jgi:hypothetical protein